TSNLNIRSICRSLSKRVESSKENNHGNNQIENDLNEKSEETMSPKLKLATQASAERMHPSRRRGRPLKRPVDVDKLVDAFTRANEILDDILTLVNLKEVSPVCNKDSTNSKIQSSTIMNSPTKEVCPNEITLTTYRATTVKDNMNWLQLGEIQDFHTSNEDKLFPDLDNIVMDEYQKNVNENNYKNFSSGK
ncbi:unnamed protein product, partial [Rotaria magnacalcarata]